MHVRVNVCVHPSVSVYVHVHEDVNVCTLRELCTDACHTHTHTHTHTRTHKYNRGLMMSSPAVELLHSSPHVYIAINFLQNLSYILTGVAHLHVQMLFMLYAHTPAYTNAHALTSTVHACCMYTSAQTAGQTNTWHLALEPPRGHELRPPSIKTSPTSIHAINSRDLATRRPERLHRPVCVSE